MADSIVFQNTWHDELPGFYTELSPTPLENARLIYHNRNLANELGIDASYFSASQRDIAESK